MKVKTIRLATLAVLAGLLASSPRAVADGWFSDMASPRQATLGDLLRAPERYEGVEVEMKLYFGGTGGSYNPYYTKFSEDIYGNFMAWPYDARLYEKRDFQQTYPFFFVQRTSKTWKHMSDLARMQPIEVRAVVQNVFRGQPWIEVISYKTLSDGLDADLVREIVAGDAYFHAGRYQDAARRYDHADSGRLSDADRVEVLRRRGDALYRAHEFDDAYSCYNRASHYLPNNHVLARDLAACKDAMQRAETMKKGGKVSGTARQIVDSSVPVTKDRTNGVDAIITLLGENLKKPKSTEDAGTVVKAEKAPAGEQPKEAAAGEAPQAQPKQETAKPAAKSNEPEAPAAQPNKTEEKGASEQPKDAGQSAPADGAKPADDGKASETQQPAAKTDKAGESPAPKTAEQKTPAAAPVQKPATEQKPAAKEPVPAPAEESHAQPQQKSQAPAPKKEAPVAPAQQKDTVTHTGKTSDTASKEPAKEAPATSEEKKPAAAKAPSGTEQPAAPAAEKPAAGAQTAKAPAAKTEAKVVPVAKATDQLPRLPFFGCEGVTPEELAAVLEEIHQHPDR